jgi:hypothetical protein
MQKLCHVLCMLPANYWPIAMTNTIQAISPLFTWLHHGTTGGLGSWKIILLIWRLTEWPSDSCGLHGGTCIHIHNQLIHNTQELSILMLVLATILSWTDYSNIVIVNLSFLGLHRSPPRPHKKIPVSHQSTVSDFKNIQWHDEFMKHDL